MQVARPPDPPIINLKPAKKGQVYFGRFYLDKRTIPADWRMGDSLLCTDKKRAAHPNGYAAL